jgi:leucyl aminopeptidase
MKKWCVGKKHVREETKSCIKIAKKLGGMPGNILTPTRLAEEAKNLHPHLEVTVLGEKEMDKEGMGLLLGVSQGSTEEAKLIVVKYHGNPGRSIGADAPPIALIGKGLTFDAGGYSLKPSSKLHQMKYDMLGAGAILAAMKAIARLALPINVVAIIPSSENLINGQATKPGDIHIGMNGTRVEILNTDAEGRLILADALTYVQTHFNPSVIVDVATLTGAAVYALGDYYTAALGNDKVLMKKIIKAGKKSGDLVYELPIHPDVHKEIKSNYKLADLKNIAEKPGPGTTTAAVFLQQFIEEDTPWVHLDIAATASSGDEITGRPVGMLIQYLVSESENVLLPV